jgi:hypothetical protein
MRVRCHLHTKNLFCSLLCFGLLSLNSVAFAQVYKSYDADGNVVFSDKPTQRSREVEVSKPNLSDSFVIPPPPPPPADPPLETKPETESEPKPVTQPTADDDSADTNNDGRVSRREKEDQRKERRKKKRDKEKAAEGYKE